MMDSCQCMGVKVHAKSKKLTKWHNKQNQQQVSERESRESVAPLRP